MYTPRTKCSGVVGQLKRVINSLSSRDKRLMYFRGATRGYSALQETRKSGSGATWNIVADPRRNSVTRGRSRSPVFSVNGSINISSRVVAKTITVVV